MILYHGSNMVVEQPEILKPSHALDFGPGFYTTLNRDRFSLIRFKRSEVVA